jgi:hypothetical protein
LARDVLVLVDEHGFGRRGAAIEPDRRASALPQLELGGVNFGIL